MAAMAGSRLGDILALLTPKRDSKTDNVKSDSIGESEGNSKDIPKQNDCLNTSLNWTKPKESSGGQDMRWYGSADRMSGFLKSGKTEKLQTVKNEVRNETYFTTICGFVIGMCIGSIITVQLFA